MSSAKAEVRRAALARRAAVPAQIRDAFSARLATLGPRLVVDFAPPNAGLGVALYSAFRGEPDMMPLARALHGAGVALSLPVTRGPGEALVFRRWSPGDVLATSALGIAEPADTAPEAQPDVLFVPLAAFDRRGQRIGYGAGHYDRTLAALRARKAIRAIGVAFSVQEEMFIPEEAHDEALDLIVTERDTVLCER